MKNKKIVPFVFLALTGCSSTPTAPSKIVVDSSGNKADWVTSGKMSWEKDDYIYYKAKQTVRGDQRVSGCNDLASLDNKEALLAGLADEVKGAIDNAQTDISENAELILGKVRSGKWEGRIVGLQNEEQYFERYQIRDGSNGGSTERVDCYLLSKISKSDYMDTKRSVVNHLVAVDPRLKEAITQKQIDFFTAKKTDDQRAPANDNAQVKSVTTDDTQDTSKDE